MTAPTDIDCLESLLTTANGVEPWAQVPMSAAEVVALLRTVIRLAKPQTGIPYAGPRETLATVGDDEPTPLQALRAALDQWNTAYDATLPPEELDQRRALAAAAVETYLDSLVGP